MPRAALILVLASTAWLCGCHPEYETPFIVNAPGPTSGTIEPFPTPSTPPSRPSANVPADWIPPRGTEKAGRWQGIIIHHSATPSGNAAYIDRLHKDRGWDGLGYHFVISNGSGGRDGLIETGWRWRQQREGAHARVASRGDNYFNEHTIGICLIGNFENTQPTAAQYASAARLTKFLMQRYRIPESKIQGHGHVDNTKCPGANFSWSRFRSALK